jgi:NADP-dependent 3-hydroxy acid dehydrogenase YdfG
MFPQIYAERAADEILQPDDIAEIYWHLHTQKRSAWTFESDVRPYTESW